MFIAEGGRYLEFGWSDLSSQSSLYPGNYDWVDALRRASGSRSGGYSDWRLPSPYELEYLYQVRFLGGPQSGTYWSSSAFGGTAVSFDFSTGLEKYQAVYYRNKVRLVRGGYATTPTTTTTTTTVSLRCAQGLECRVGDIGPGGGTVFYVAYSTFASPGSDCASSCRYLEVAPAPASSWGDPKLPWGNPEPPQGRLAKTDFYIGSGMANTAAIIWYNGSVAEAAIFADEYVNGGKNDWHLPSYEELMKLYDQTRRGNVSGLDGKYWSSTRSTFDTIGIAARFLDFRDGNFYARASLDESLGVRPVRAF